MDGKVKLIRRQRQVQRLAESKKTVMAWQNKRVQSVRVLFHCLINKNTPK